MGCTWMAIAMDISFTSKHLYHAITFLNISVLGMRGGSKSMDLKVRPMSHCLPSQS
jgi:hypothetical protein